MLFGTAGIPISTEKRNTENGIEQVRKLNLDAMELEFVRSINITKQKAPDIKAAAKKHNIKLTCHAPYFINLNSLEKPKIHASINRILNSARIANLCGASSVTFHPAFYMKIDKEKVYETVKKNMEIIIKTLKDESNPITVRPETTGKATQFGDIDEIIKLSQELDNVQPCIDFSHLHARSGGKLNSFKEFKDIVGKVQDNLGKKAIKNLHCHVSGIAYSEKGEQHHLTLKQSDLKYKDLMKALKHCNGIIISESPNIEKDAQLLKSTYASFS